MQVSFSTTLCSASLSTWHQRIEASAALSATTTIALIILAASSVPLGVVGYSLLSATAIASLAASFVSYYYVEKAFQQLQEIIVREEMPVVPDKIRTCDSYQIAKEISENSRPLFPLLKETLKSALRDYHQDSNRQFPAIDEGMSILSEEIHGIFEEHPRQLYDLI
ncbi:MAG: hypothetical protein WAM28_04620, partial [Chlamydiales bacterium]